MSAAQASAAGCIGCEAGTQWAKRHSTLLSWARAEPAHSSAAASARVLSCVIRSSLNEQLLLIITVRRRAAKADLAHPSLAARGGRCSQYVKASVWSFSAPTVSRASPSSAEERRARG